MAPRFIVVEGIDGSGTTTQTKRLVQAMLEQGRPAVGSCEPTTGPIGRLIRGLLGSSAFPEPRWQTMALLFAADRSEHCQQIELMLGEGTTVVSDRYDLSSRIYQSLTAEEPDAALTWVGELNASVRRPDLTLVLDLPAEIAEERRRLRGGPVERFEVPALQKRLALAYRDAERFIPNDLVRHIDAAATPEQVATAIRAAVDELD